MYTAELINRHKLYFKGDDIPLRFIVRDEDGALLTNFDNLGIKCEITNYGDETKLSDTAAGGSDDEISISDSEITVHVPNADTVDYAVGYFIVELQLEDLSESDNTQYYTIFSDKIYFEDETLDW